ncbi:transposable element Tcb1 transposase [Trichonephila clavipes]|nr:transposable element Tcb1 transposase [Trichonephila clavipes]
MSFTRRSDSRRPRQTSHPEYVHIQHTAPTACVMVWSAIAYNTRSPLVLICGTKTAQRYVHDIMQTQVLPPMQPLPRAIFSKTMPGLTRQGSHKTVSALLHGRGSRVL